MWPFRPPQTPSDDLRQHRATLDLIEQVAALRGQVNAMASEWDDVKDQVRRSYQRIEKAAERLEKAKTKKLDGWDDDDEDAAAVKEPTPEVFGFAKKLADFRKEA